LIVDDDQIDVRAITRALRKHRIDNPVDVAANGVEALNLLKGINGKKPIAWPYIILLDLNMPRMSGLEFLEEIRNDESLHDTVIFVLTTSDDDRDKAKAYEQHIAGYIVKSTVGKDFINLVSMIENFVLTVSFQSKGL
ncbi:MAG: response regulator, partial [Pseudomonadales bacterium]